MTFVSISTICTNISDAIKNTKSLSNITTRCIVKKVSQYPYIIFMDVTDVDNTSYVLTATINVNLYKNDLKSNDIVIITGNISFSKSINFRITRYYIDKPQMSKYELIVEKLKKFNLIDIPYKPIPHTIKNVAIISSSNAAGLKDCLDVISHLTLKNIYIYPTTVQGQFMEESVLRSMEKIHNERIERKIDVILLIRGGGSKTDLEWFDNYKIAKSIKHSKIPVICGIGHEIDHTIMDIVCDKSCNTPTQVAYYLTDIVSNYKKTNQMLNILYHSKIGKILNTINQANEAIGRQNQLIRKESENSILKLTQIYQNKINLLLRKYDIITRTIIDGNIWYEKLFTKIIDYDNKINNKLNHIKSESNDYVNKFANIKIYNKTGKRYVRSKKDYNIAMKKGSDLYIRFIDGKVDIKIEK